MSAINYPKSCVTNYANTGLPSCFVSIDHLKGLVICYDGFKIPAANLTSFATTLAYLQTATLAANPLERAYPLHIIEGLTDNTAAPEKKNSGYGNTQYTSEQPHQFEIELENVGIEFYKKLRTFNGKKNVRVYWLDEQFIGGYEDSNGDLLPMEASLFFKQVKPGNIADYTKYMLDLELKNSKSLTDDLDVVAITDGTDLKNELNGIIDITLAGTGGILSANVTAVMAISKEDFITKHLADIQDVGFLVDGTATEPTTIANGIALFTLTAGSHKIKMNTPSALAEGGMGSPTAGGYESNEITVIVTAS